MTRATGRSQPLSAVSVVASNLRQELFSFTDEQMVAALILKKDEIISIRVIVWMVRKTPNTEQY